MLPFLPAAPSRGLAKHRGPGRCSHQGGAAFVGKLVPMKTQKTTCLPSSHAAFAVMRGSVLGRQVPELGRKTVAPYQSYASSADLGDARAS